MPDYSQAGSVGQQYGLANLEGEPPPDQPKSGLLSEAGNLWDIAKNVVPGMWGMGVDAAETAANVGRVPGTILAKGLGSALGMNDEQIASATHTPGVNLLTIPEVFEQDQETLTPATEGIGAALSPEGSALFARGAERFFPLFHQTGASMQRTGGRLVDTGAGVGQSLWHHRLDDLSDTQYAKAYGEGRLTPLVLEDLANATLVADLGGGALAGKVAEESGAAAAARQAADAARPLTVDAAEQEARVAAQRAAGVPGPIPEQVTDLAATSGRGSAQTVAGEVPIEMGPVGKPSVGRFLSTETPAEATARMNAEAEVAATHQARADALQPFVDAFDKVAGLTGRGAMAPATAYKLPGILGETGGGRFGLFSAEEGGRLFPFGPEGSRTGLVGYMKDRGIDRLADTRLGGPVVAKAEQTANRLAQKRLLSNMVMDKEASVQDAAQGAIAPFARAEHTTDAAGRVLGLGEDSAGQVPSMEAAQVAQGLRDRDLVPLLDNETILRALTDKGMTVGEARQAFAEDLVRGSYPDMAPEQVTARAEALVAQNALARGTLDERAAGLFDEAKAQQAEARGAKQSAYLSGKGEAGVPPESTLRERREQLGTVAMPSQVARDIAPLEDMVRSARGDLHDALVAQQKAGERRLLSPDELALSDRQLVQGIYDRARQAATDQVLADEAGVRASFGYAEDMTAEQVTADLAGRLASRVLRADPELAAIAEQQGFETPFRVPNPGTALGATERAAARRGVAEQGARDAERLTATERTDVSFGDYNRSLFARQRAEHRLARAEAAAGEATQGAQEAMGRIGQRGAEGAETGLFPPGAAQEPAGEPVGGFTAKHVVEARRAVKAHLESERDRLRAEFDDVTSHFGHINLPRKAKMTADEKALVDSVGGYNKALLLRVDGRALFKLGEEEGVGEHVIRKSGDRLEDMIGELAGRIGDDQLTGQLAKERAFDKIKQTTADLLDNQRVLREDATKTMRTGFQLSDPEAVAAQLGMDARLLESGTPREVAERAASARNPQEEMAAYQAMRRVDEAGVEPWRMARDDFHQRFVDIQDELARAEAAGDDLAGDRLYDELDALDPPEWEWEDLTTDQLHARWQDEAERAGRPVSRETGDMAQDRAIAESVAKVDAAFRDPSDATIEALTPDERRIFREQAAKEFAAGRRIELDEARQLVTDNQRALREQAQVDALAREGRRVGRRTGPTEEQTWKARTADLSRAVAKTAREQRRIGGREALYEQSNRAVAHAEKAWQAAEDALKQGRREAIANPKNAPAKYAEAQRWRTAASDVIRGYAEDGRFQGAEGYLMQLADDISRTDTATMAELTNPRHIISGEPPAAAGSAGPSVLGGRRRTTASKNKSRVEQSGTDYSARGQGRAYANEARKRVANEFSRDIARTFGKTGPEMGFEGLAGRDLDHAMRGLDEPMVPWDPTIGKAAHGGSSADTVYLPEFLVKHATKALAPDSAAAELINKWYDKRFLGPIKMWQLGLSPKWLVGNLAGNVMMATLGGGVAPWDYIANLPKARDLLAEPAPAGWAEGTALQRKLFARREEQVARGDALRARGYELPEELKRGFSEHEGRFLHPEGQFGDEGWAAKNPVRQTARLGFQANEFTDNVSRSAVYLSKIEPRRALWERLEREPSESSKIARQFAETASGKQALNEALRAAGDFQRMTHFEREVVKRAVIFYPWYRHITKLVMSLPIYSPTRVVWTLHLADLFGNPDKRDVGAGLEYAKNAPPYVQGGLPINADQSIAIGGMNPFTQGLESPAFSAENAMSALTPAIRWPWALLTGRDLSHGDRDLTRAPGTRRLDEYGREVGTPLLSNPLQALTWMGKQFPQGRVADKLFGGGIMRYDTGDPMLSHGRTLPANGPQGVGGAAIQLFGVPYATDAQQDVYETTKQKRELAAWKARRKYQAQLASASSQPPAG